jgi:hypothetical protein
MPLDKNGLQTSIGAAFEKAKATPPPADPKDSDNIQHQVLSQLARDLAAAIDTFVRSGDVVQVKPRQRILYAGAELNRLYPGCSISTSNHTV